MNHRYITFIPFCTLLIATSTQAGFGNRFNHATKASIPTLHSFFSKKHILACKSSLIRNLPRIAAATSCAMMMHPTAQTLYSYSEARRPEYYHKYISKDRSLWAKHILMDLNLLDGKTDNIQIVIGTQWSCHADCFITAPINFYDSVNPDVALLHEVKHLIDHHGLKQILFRGFLNGSSWLTVTLLLKHKSALFQKAPTAFETILKSLIICGAPTALEPIISIFAMPYYSRHHEQATDAFAIQHIKQPYKLEEAAEYYKKCHISELVYESCDKAHAINQFGPIVGSTKFFFNKFYKTFTSTHPSYINRAEKFEKAAQKRRF